MIPSPLFNFGNQAPAESSEGALPSAEHSSLLLTSLNFLPVAPLHQPPSLLDATGKTSSSNGTEPTDADNDSVGIPEGVKEGEVDALLANELNAMSLEERERTYEEIHGVDQIPDETPAFLHQKFLQFDEALRRIPNNLKAAYMQALQQDSAYIQNPKFRLMFLRSTLFDVDAAATRLVDFLQGKLDLFGPQTLTRSVYLTDLDKDDMAYLKSGAYQHLPSRDSVGRAAIVDFHLVVEHAYKHPKNLLRTLAFLQLAAAEDEETQKRGMVGIVYYVGNFTGNFNHPLNKQVARLAKWFPLRISGFHICFDDPRLRAWKPLAMLLMGKKMRVRVRFHDGTHTEVRYSLLTFGVPVSVLPISYQGELKTANHMKWISRRRFKEEQLKSVGSFEGIDLPARNDVILRRGRVFQEHPGNIQMRHLIEAVQDEYANAAGKEKMQIASRIVSEIQTVWGGRFLERDQADGWWIIVDDKEACKRVSKAIRSMRSTVTAKKHEAPPSETSNYAPADDRGKRARLDLSMATDEKACYAVLPCFAPSSGGDPTLITFNGKNSH